MAGGITFRSSVNGFNRNEVIEYINGILEEKQNLLTQLEELKADKEKAESELKNALEMLEEEKKKCDTCDIAAKAEAKLGAAMLDAKRFSESLVREAEERTFAVFSNASEKAENAVSEASRITDMLNDFLANCTESVSSVADKLAEVKNALEVFGETLSAESVLSRDKVPVKKSGTERTEKPMRVTVKASAKSEDVKAESKTNNTSDRHDVKKREIVRTAADNADITSAVLPDNEEADSEIISVSQSSDRFGSFSHAREENAIDDECASITEEEARTPLFADSDDDDNSLMTENGTDEPSDEDKDGDGRKFVPDFGFDDDFTIKVDLDD